MSPVIRDAVISPEIGDMLFKLIQIEVQCCKNCFKISLSQEVEASRNNIEKEPHNPHPKLKNYKYRIFTKNICSSLQVLLFCNFAKWY